MNISRAVDNIKKTNVYTPIIEVIVNAIQAIDETGRSDGLVRVVALRDSQLSLDESMPEVIGFEIEDNGVGFTDEHRDSFDTLYTSRKETLGGKGFGRFILLKYFNHVDVLSNYEHSNRLYERTFKMGMDQDIIVSETNRETTETEPGTHIRLTGLKSRQRYDKKLRTIAHALVEKLLPYFITDGYHCPKIVLSEEPEGEEIVLNDFVSNELSAAIQEVLVPRSTFTLGKSGSQEDFIVRLFKFYSPRNQKSRISLVAHQREVATTTIDRYVPEFADDFFEVDDHGDQKVKRNYIVKAYVFGDFLDQHVSLERGDFDFFSEPNLIYQIDQSQIEESAASIASSVLDEEISSRKQKKQSEVQAFVDRQAPWHKTILRQVDLSKLPYHPNDGEINAFLDQARFEADRDNQAAVNRILSEADWEDQREHVAEIANKISDSSRDELTHYIVKRRWILEMFEKSLELDANGRYSSEGTVHDIIFPRKGDTDSTSFDDHNLWILDERLNFTQRVDSDVPLAGGASDRPDILVWDQPVMFRGENESSNPVTIFEFKRPQRDDFVNQSAKDDPVQQVIRYVSNIKDGKFTTKQGRTIRVSDSTPFYGYVVCDISPKVDDWLFKEKDFTPMPDRLGWFSWRANLNLYMEVLSWEKLLKDATCRNKIFFHKLNI